MIALYLASSHRLGSGRDRASLNLGSWLWLDALSLLWRWIHLGWECFGIVISSELVAVGSQPKEEASGWHYQISHVGILATNHHGNERTRTCSVFFLVGLLHFLVFFIGEAICQIIILATVWYFIWRFGWHQLSCGFKWWDWDASELRWVNHIANSGFNGVGWTHVEGRAAHHAEDYGKKQVSWAGEAACIGSIPHKS